MILISALILFNIAGARAGHLDNMYRDQIRPHGHVRSDAIYDANLDACYDQTGADRNVADTATFKKCMLMRGWRWQYTRLVRDAVPAEDNDTMPAETPASDDSITSQANAIAESEVEAAAAATLQSSVDSQTAINSANAQ
jgi:hypothetical protein